MGGGRGEWGEYWGGGRGEWGKYWGGGTREGETIGEEEEGNVKLLGRKERGMLNH